jgi:histidine phosphotransferase ChpT
MGVDIRDLNALIGSRICHDLISPLGAIGNGVELLAMSGISAAPEIALIAESIENANARIKFFRVAFGAAGNGAMIGRSEAIGILRDIYRNGRMIVDWRVSEDCPRGEVKLAFLVIQCLESSMPRGGAIRVLREGGRWRLVAEGENLRMDPDLWAVAEGRRPDAEVSASDVHFALAPLAADYAGRRVELRVSETRATVSF